MTEFIHLHSHSEYSMLQAAARIKNMVQKASQHGQKALALTDHGNMFGMLEFYTNAKKAGIKPIVGCDFYVARGKRTEPIPPGKQNGYSKLILIAKNQPGYKNLLKLCSLGFTEGLQHKPLIDKEILSSHAEGLICLSSNFQGAIGQAIVDDDMDAANSLIEYFQDVFGKDDFYLCVQDHKLEPEQKVNAAFLEFHKQKNIPLVATNDVHYVEQKDAEAYDVILCIEGNWKLDDPNRPKRESDQYYLKSSEEMEKILGHFPGAIQNTLAIADKCDLEIEFGKLYWPRSPTPKGFKNDHDYLRHLSLEGVKKRYSNVTPEILERVHYELEVMEKMSVSGYMLIVQDFINAAKKMNIPVGPGRGSAVGSIVSYVIGITDVDPLRFNLLFERFLNPERVSMPDIDTDFSDRDRGKVIKYVVQKYGVESVAQIVTYGRMKAKMVLRDVGRAMGFEAQELNRICKLFPPDKPFADLKESIESSPDLKKDLSSEPQKERLQNIALNLEGFVRQAGMHAAAVIIAPEPVVNFAPLFRQPGSDQLMIQYDKQFSEEIGLLKMDFLGLRNLSVIQDCLKEVELKTGQTLDPLTLPENDPKTLELLGKGLTVGVFQFESGGMQDYLRKLKPTGIEDLIAMNALYRPGPIENIPNYIARKNGNEKIDYYHKNLEPILGETYGVIVYQEQVMQIAQVLSGFTLGGADEMRRAMAKKNVEKMDKLKPKFIDGAEERGYPRKVAETIWDTLVPFSSYAFNKSHSAAYATIAYQTAYLKAHFPSEFLAANMSSEIDNTDRLVILLNDCKQLDIEVICPNINHSHPQFVSKGRSIIYGLAGIKNVGMSAAEKLVEERKENGPFKSVLDLCKRLDVSYLNRRAIESLIYAGAMDDLPGSRAQQYASVEEAMLLAAKYHRDKELGQTFLFDSPQQDSNSEEEELSQPDVDPWPYSELLGKEKEVLGLYLSGHPLEPHRMEIEAFTGSALDALSLEKVKTESSIILGGILTSLRKRISQKDNRTFAFGVLEDFSGKIEVVFWSDTYEKYMEHIEIDNMVLIRGKFKRDVERKDEPKLVAERILPISDAREKLTQSIHVKLNASGLQHEDIDKLFGICDENHGNCDFVLHLNTMDKDHRLKSRALKVSSYKDFTQQLEEIAGEGNVWISDKQPV